MNLAKDVRWSNVLITLQSASFKQLPPYGAQDVQHKPLFQERACANAALMLEIVMRVITMLCMQVLAPHRRVLFLDTDNMPAPEVRSGDALSNPQEAAVITDIVTALMAGQLPLEDIGIISPYRAQVGIDLMHTCYHYMPVVVNLF